MKKTLNIHGCIAVALIRSTIELTGVEFRYQPPSRIHSLCFVEASITVLNRIL
jgi:hypothetical protein